jgi:3-isopropylmalate dehydrogenase
MGNNKGSMMPIDRSYRIAVLPGDGIGPEVMTPALKILTGALRLGGASKLLFQGYAAGAEAYRTVGEALPAATIVGCLEADAILLGAMGDPTLHYTDGTELTPQIDLRHRLDLYAGVRPLCSVPGLPSPLASVHAKSLDIVIVRESTEGLFYSLGRPQLNLEDEAFETLRISRGASTRVVDFALKLAGHRKDKGLIGRVTCVDKANVFPAFAFFRRIFQERAAAFPCLLADASYVDAVALNLVREPWRYDVIVTENMFGDILSDLCAGLVGGIGLAPSADIGDGHAVFQPCHGSAPDIAGQGRANPIAMILSTVLMLEWLAERFHDPSLDLAAAIIRLAVNTAFVDGTSVPMEFGGTDGTNETADRVFARLKDSERILRQGGLST